MTEASTSQTTVAPMPLTAMLTLSVASAKCWSRMMEAVAAQLHSEAEFDVRLCSRLASAHSVQELIEELARCQKRYLTAMNEVGRQWAVSAEEFAATMRGAK